ncbi:MAG TPA: hypothetical protein VGP99_03785, partial [Tepidisphaeraceae bacterium]|nr:hypothetical protein [Tepidisphaeraceae bacterium]
MAIRAGAVWILLLLVRTAAGQELPFFYFRDETSAEEWKPNRHVNEMKVTGEGLLIDGDNTDPFITGPARDYPGDKLLWLRMRIKSEKGGSVQVFYYKDGSREENSIKEFLAADQWEDLRLPLPALGKGYHLRIDPPRGKTILARVAFEQRDVLKAPEWPAPVALKLPADAASIRVPALQLIHSSDELGGFEVRVADRPVAVGGNRGLIGYVIDGKQRWINLHKSARVAVRKAPLEAEARFTDEDGADWTIVQNFRNDVIPGMIDVRTEVSVSKDRDVCYLPIVFLFAGVDTFGKSKTDAIFPGLEYLGEDEPSSSEKDVIGPGANRKVPDSAKITIPLMAVGADFNWVGLMWEPSDSVAAVFDSPDRLFKSGGHVMGLIFPGAGPQRRSEGNLLPSYCETIHARKSITFHATIAGGGTGALGAVELYLWTHRLPAIPQTGLNLAGFAELCAAGWLDSKIGVNGLFRHAYPGNFNAHPAADAAAMMDWAAASASNKALSARVAESSKLALSKLKPREYAAASVGHIRTPVAPLLYGGAEEAAAQAKERGTELLRRFDADGRARYKPPAGQIDLGSTHSEHDANGLTANLVAGILEAGVLSGDRELIAQGLKLLKGLDRFDNTPPRGAQTWEIPLHTPDILASAHLVRAYTHGYELSGDKKMLQRASRWAWSGVPFVYLVNPSDKPIGPYSTIAVLGATHWKAPNWMGQPVQWCGLVYADALYRLARHEPKMPWKTLADGIVASGMQQTWPIGSDPERQGLLPDSFVPRRQ